MSDDETKAERRARLMRRFGDRLAQRIANPSEAYKMHAMNTDTDQALASDMFAGQIKGVIPLTHNTDANDWYAMGDPSKVQTFSFARLEGVSEPEMFWQSDPESPTMYDADTGKIKIRF